LPVWCCTVSPCRILPVLEPKLRMGELSEATNRDRPTEPMGSIIRRTIIAHRRSPEDDDTVPEGTSVLDVLSVRAAV